VYFVPFSISIFKSALSFLVNELINVIPRDLDKKEYLLIILAFVSIYIIWGSTYLFNKILVGELSPFLIGAIRFTIAGALVVGLSLLFGKNKEVTKQQLYNCGKAGFFFLTTGNGIAIWALQYMDSGLTALLISAQPLVLLILMWILDGKKIQVRSMIGIALGILGIYLLVSQNSIEHHPRQWLGFIAIFCCLLFWGYGSLFVAKADLPDNSLISTGYQMLFGGIMMIGMSLALGEDTSGLFNLSTEGIWAMVYLVLFGSIAAFTSFNFLLKRVSPEKVATSTYINPIVAMCLGVWWLGEKISMVSIIAAVILLSGVWFINSVKRNPADT